MDRTKVKSSNLVSAGYDAASQLMELEFKGGGTYQFHDVPQAVYDAFMAADSKGSHFHREIRGKYRHTKV